MYYLYLCISILFQTNIREQIEGMLHVVLHAFFFTKTYVHNFFA